MGEPLLFPSEYALKLEPHLPPPSGQHGSQSSGLPHVTLTFATSLDSSLSLSPGVRTILSGPQSKAMTHYLRSRHDAILVGVGTAVADDPGLNCRLASSLQPDGHQPRPIVLDPTARWRPEESKVLRLVEEGAGLAPFVITCVGGPEAVWPETRRALEEHGGKYIFLDPAADGRLDWTAILQSLGREGLGSVMVEGGGHVINSLLEQASNALVNSVIVTIAPTWLGKGGVVVSPDRTNGTAAAVRLTGVSWLPMGDDAVMCGKILPPSEP